MQQAKQLTGQPLLTDEEAERMMELVSARLESAGHPRDSEGKPVLTQEIIGDAMLEVVRERYEKKFQQLEQQFVKPLAAAIERFEQRQPDQGQQKTPPEMTLAWWHSLGDSGVRTAVGISWLVAAILAVIFFLRGL